MEYVKIDFDKWSLNDLTAYQEANANDEYDTMYTALARLITEWSFEGNPANPASYQDLTFVQMFSVFKAIGNELKFVIDEWSNPKVKDTGVVIDLNQWTYPEFRAFQKAQESGDLSSVQDRLHKIVVKIDGKPVTEEQFKGISVTRYARVLGALFKAFKELSAEGN